MTFTPTTIATVHGTPIQVSSEDNGASDLVLNANFTALATVCAAFDVDTDAHTISAASPYTFSGGGGVPGTGGGDSFWEEVSGGIVYDNNVGVGTGTTAPAAPLHVKSSTTSAPTMRVENTAQYTQRVAEFVGYGSPNNDVYIDGFGAFNAKSLVCWIVADYTAIKLASAASMVWTSAWANGTGDVGLARASAGWLKVSDASTGYGGIIASGVGIGTGTTAPSAALHIVPAGTTAPIIVGSTAAPIFSVGTAGNATLSSGMRVGYNADYQADPTVTGVDLYWGPYVYSRWYFDGSHHTHIRSNWGGALLLGTQTSDGAVCITDSGYVGIGTLPAAWPTSPLHVVAPNATTSPVVVQGPAWQSADLVQFKDTDSNVLCRLRYPEAGRVQLESDYIACLNGGAAWLGSNGYYLRLYYNEFTPSQGNMLVGTAGSPFAGGYYQKITLSGTPPAHNTSAGTAGDIAVDSSYVYVCTATGTEGNATWKRVALAADTW